MYKTVQRESYILLASVVGYFVAKYGFGMPMPLWVSLSQTVVSVVLLAAVLSGVAGNRTRVRYRSVLGFKQRRNQPTPEVKC